VGKIAEKAVCRIILSAELTKTHSFRLVFVDFAYWEEKLFWFCFLYIHDVLSTNWIKNVYILHL